IARDVARFDEAVDELLDARLGGGELRLDLVAGCRSGSGLAGRRRELVARAFQPVTEALVADDVVEVVSLDALKMRRFGPFTLAQLQPLLKCHDARAGVAQVDLAGEAVELLHPLDRVALDRRAQRLADRPRGGPQDWPANHVVEP